MAPGSCVPPRRLSGGTNHANGGPDVLRSSNNVAQQQIYARIGPSGIPWTSTKDHESQNTSSDKTWGPNKGPSLSSFASPRQNVLYHPSSRSEPGASIL